MTSNDRHANHDSPYRSLSNMGNQHIGVGRNPELQAVTSPGDDTSLNLSYHDENRSTTALASQNGVYSSRSPNGNIQGPNSLYSPGMRSSVLQSDGPSGGIALQDFGTDGSPPPPPVSHSWSRIDRWCEDNYPELFDQLCTPASVNDINELEYNLDCSLPMEVRDSLQFHDGQERGGMPTGLIFGAMLLDCEEMLDEWKNWRKVEKEYLAKPTLAPPTPSAEPGPSRLDTGSIGRRNLQARQESQPEGAVVKAYVHPGWIPMVRDWGGNNIAVDLAPGPNGTWGQVILFGRDYDTKFVVAKSWAHFLAMVADDLASPHWWVDEETQELKLKDPRAPRSEPPYMEILRVRNERKYGRRRISVRKSMSPTQSPHPSTMSPTAFGSVNGQGPRGGLTRPLREENTMSDNHLKPPSKKSSKPLRSVTEELPAPIPVHTKVPSSSAKAPAANNLLDEPLLEEKLSDTVQKLEDVALNDDKKLKRAATDIASHPPPSAAVRRSSLEV
ncbi:cell wall assembly and cell proliferation coordinating protein [Choiromyces venosus 120613-1]|uniref:Cell wall assembly and cell proliferation coordinating protein n=1 Tax=Choiromyces venosus 120613-1 TaxID=1336337 RepID=A0A3N4JPA6_9PEZI|nr:cell wall assembly and cell proliferation coordinating protein [Choiromyces venosus 120613-1]